MNPIIEDIEVDTDELNKIMIKPDTRQRRWEIRKLIGGTCTYCGDIPKKKLLYDIDDGGKLVEWYCDKCFKRWIEGRHKKDIDKLDSRKDLK